MKVFDAAGNRADVFRRGVNRSVFDVWRQKRKPEGRRARPRAARVQTMVVGKQGVIVDPITVRARKTVVRASGRRCAVAASTPLGALAGRAASQADRLRGPRLRQLRATQHPQLGPAVRDPDRARAQQRRGRVGVQDRRPHAGNGRGGRAAADR